MSESSRTMLDRAREALNARMTKDDLRLVLENTITHAEALRARLAEYEAMAPQQCPAGKHADWLVDSEYAHACPWCQIDDLKARLAEYERPADEDPIRYTLTEQTEATEYRYCGADLGRTEYPYTCNRRIAHKGPCDPTRDDAEDDVTPQVARLRAVLAEDPARCLKVHPFSPRDGWRIVCANCDHLRDAACHQGGDA